MLKYFFSTRLSPSSEALNSGNLQRLDAGLDQEGEHGQLLAGLLVFLVHLDAEGFQVGDVGIFVIGDGRDHHPVARQVLAGNLLDARQRLDSISPNLAKSTFGHGSRSSTPPPLTYRRRKRPGRKWRRSSRP
jgi:hypothetical protein